MSAASYDISLEQGATYTQTFTWKDGSNNPISLVGYTARMQIRLSASASSILWSLTTENGGITLGGTAGTIVLYIDDVDTASLSFTTAQYDLELESASGFVTRLMEGKITLSPEVTR